MSLTSRLAVPAIIGGAIALFFSGTFTPPAMALGYNVETIARIADLPGLDHLEVRKGPAPQSQKAGDLRTATWVWVERCVEVEQSDDWCLVERAQTKGWVNSSFLTVHWE